MRGAIYPVIFFRAVAVVVGWGWPREGETGLVKGRPAEGPVYMYNLHSTGIAKAFFGARAGPLPALELDIQRPLIHVFLCPVRAIDLPR